MTVEGQVERITFHNPDTGYTVLRLSTGRESVAVVGQFHGLKVGERVRVDGEFVVHPVYGRQLKATQYETFVPTTAAGIEAYLGSGVVKGVGPEIAHRLVETFGNRTMDVILGSPQRLHKVPGIGRARARAIQERVLANQESQPVLMFLQEHGVTPGLARRIYERYGTGAVGLVRENPYRLAEDMRGVGFRIADRIAMGIGFDPTSPLRAQAAVEYLLSEAGGSGHCFLPQSELAEALSRLLLPDSDGEVYDGAPILNALRLRERIVSEAIEGPDGEPDEAIYLTPVYRLEMRAARAFVRLASGPAGPIPPVLTDPDGGAQDVTLSPEQAEAVTRALRSRVFILTGGPGTGKTTIVRTLIRSFEAKGIPCLLGAPTGRAAKRLAEATGRSARTLHRLLEYGRREERTVGDRGEGRNDSDRGPSFGFLKDRDNPLPSGAVIVDEVSMVDLWLFAHLLDAMPPDGRLILVGDADQLPSVGAGNVLRDLLQAGLADSARLSRIYRQAAGSQIAENAHRILAGDMPVFTEPDGEFSLDERGDPAQCAERVTDLATSLGPLEDVQVLTPMRRGEAGVEALNVRLQATLNPPRTGRPEFRIRPDAVLRLGDKVMQTRNNYQKSVFNGDTGMVTWVSPEQGTIRVRYPEPEGDREVIYVKGEIDEVTLAYAVSVHKSQGSEYPTVILALLTQHYMLLQRNLLYTAVTRAKSRVALVGQKRAVAIALHNNRVAERHTRLAERIRHGVS